MTIIRITINDMADWPDGTMEHILRNLKEASYTKRHVPDDEGMQAIIFFSNDPHVKSLDIMFPSEFTSECSSYGLYIELLSPAEAAQYEPFTRRDEAAATS